MNTLFQLFFNKTQGVEKYGLTTFGTLVVNRMTHLSMILDVVHASDHLLDGELFPKFLFLHPSHQIYVY